jgi:hypothetical protein
MAPTGPTFFGYWAGRLPALSELHFRSVLRHHPEARYELWLDADHASRVDAPALRWLRGHPRVALREFSLDVLIERHAGGRPVARVDRLAHVRRIGRALHRRCAPQWTRRQAWEHPDGGLSYSHGSSLFAGFHADRVYRSHLARCLIPLEHYAQACVYADLDVAFAADVSPHCADKAWTYRWRGHACGCPSVLYLPDRSWSAALARRGNELGSYAPWVLFGEDVCAELGVALHPAALFDPTWDPASFLHGRPQGFLERRERLGLDLHALAGERHLAIRWHADWTAQPAEDSLYAALLRDCAPAAST